MRFRERVGQCILALGFLSGCAGARAGEHPVSPAAGEPRMLKAVTLNRALDVIQSRADAGSMGASFRPMPGALIGSVFSDPVLLVPVRFGENFSLPLSDLARSIAPVAQPANAQTLGMGMVVTPAETRLARLGTFFYDGDTKKDVSGAGMFDALTRENMMLMYFDRPCTVHGDMQALGKTVSIALDVTAPGVYWIRLAEVDATHQKLIVDASNTPVWYARTE